MNGPYAIYETFNWIEGLIWIGFAAFLLLKIKPKGQRQRFSVFAAALGFSAFALSDFLEARTHGDVPFWLWFYKIACATLLLSCRFTWTVCQKDLPKLPERKFYSARRDEEVDEHQRPKSNAAE